MSLTKVSFSMITGAFVNVLDFGADPTGVNDSLAAFNAAIASFTDPVHTSRGGTIFVPRGYYYLSGTLEIKKHINIIEFFQRLSEKEPVKDLKKAGFSPILENEFIIYQNQYFEIQFDINQCQFQVDYMMEYFVGNYLNRII
jgi:hypothetical protein